MIEHNGKKYARVSEILQPFTDFSHIEPKVLARKAQIGTNVHAAISESMDGGFTICPPPGDGYFLSFVKWKATLGLEFIKSEQRYYDDESMLTGQIDALMDPGKDDKLGFPVLVDFKTSATESKETWPMQAHLYAYLLAKNGILVANRYLFVKLNKLGDLPQVFTYTWKANTHAKCMEAIDLFWSKQEKDSRLLS